MNRHAYDNFLNLGALEFGTNTIPPRPFVSLLDDIDLGPSGREAPDALSTCARCGRLVPRHSLNLEARIHHGARALECLDRRECERARRKATRRGK